jgi:hypothetical protein
MNFDERLERIDERLAGIRKTLEENAAMRRENERMQQPNEILLTQIGSDFKAARDSIARLEAKATAALHRRRGVEGGL